MDSGQLLHKGRGLSLLWPLALEWAPGVALICSGLEWGPSGGTLVRRLPPPLYKLLAAIAVDVSLHSFCPHSHAVPVQH